LIHISPLRNVYEILVGKGEGKRPLGRPRRKWEDIRICLREIGCEGVNWMHLTQDRDRGRALVKMVMNFRAS